MAKACVFKYTTGIPVERSVSGIVAMLAAAWAVGNAALAATQEVSLGRLHAAGAAEWLYGYIKGLLEMEPSAYTGAALRHLPEELERLKKEAGING